MSWKTVGIIGFAAVGLVTYFNYEQEKHKQEKEAEINRGAGKPLVGGPFSLVDDLGRPVSDLDFLGKWMLIYFGYTFCPDVCPEELDKMAAVVNKVREIKDLQGEKVVPIFVSCDPKRDSVQVIHDYVKEFHPDFVGLTGTYHQIKKAAKSYRLYFSAPPKSLDDDDRDYLVDHSIFFYLMNPKGEFVAHFGKPDTADSATERIVNEMRRYKIANRN